MTDLDPKASRGPSLKCPICGRAAQAGFRPFCSRRCADHDLGRWLNGEYRIPGPPADTDQDEET